MHLAQYVPGQGLLLLQRGVGGGLQEHQQRVADALLERYGLYGGDVVGKAPGDVVGQLLCTGEEDVAGARIDRLAPEQAREVRVGEGFLEVFYGLVCPVVWVLNMFIGQLQRIQAVAISITRKHDFPR